MKAVVLAGGRGTRMGRAAAQPKPLLEIGDKPVLAHVMDIYLAAGVTEFVICAGYRFPDFVRWLDEVADRVPTGSPDSLGFTLATDGGAFTVTLVDTGEETSSGGRLRRVQQLIDDTFFLTYADGLADVDLMALLELHRLSGASVSLTAFPLNLRYGIVDIEDDQVLARSFQEKPVIDRKWCNGGFYVVEPSVVRVKCNDDQVDWEAEVLPKVASEGSLGVLRHDGFWASMDFAHQHDELKRIWQEHGPIWLSKGR